MKEIIGFRNVLIHGYDIVSRPRLWDSAEKDVPELLEILTALLDAKP